MQTYCTLTNEGSMDSRQRILQASRNGSKHVTTSKEVQESCIPPNGKEMKMIWTVSAKIIATVNGLPRSVLLNDVQRSEHLPRNTVSYERLEAKGCKLMYRELFSVLLIV